MKIMSYTIIKYRLLAVTRLGKNSTQSNTLTKIWNAIIWNIFQVIQKEIWIGEIYKESKSM